MPEDRKDQGLILEQSIIQNLVLSILNKISRAGFVNAGREKRVCDEYIDN